MITVQVEFKIKKNEIKEFIDITRYNVENSRIEEGVLSFNFYRKSEVVFLLMESYKSKNDQELHRKTDHYKKWKSIVSEIIERPYKITVLELMY